MVIVVMRRAVFFIAFVLVFALLAASMDTVRNAKIDVAKTYTNEFVDGR